MLLDPDILTQIQSFSIGPVTVHLYGIIIGIGLAAGLFCFSKIAPESIKQDKKTPLVIVSTAMLAILGGRIAYVIGHTDEFHDFVSILSIWDGGSTIFGVLAGGIIGVGLSLKILQPEFSLLQFLDYAAPATAIGQAIGRWANYVNQELYGLPTEMPWGIPIDKNHRITNYELFEKFHPTFIYESILNALSAAILILLLKKTKIATLPGTLTGTYFIAYGIIRVVMERFRIDSEPIMSNLKPADLAAFALIISGGILVRHARAKSRQHATSKS